MTKTIYTDPSIHSSEITPESIFLNRRNVMKSAGGFASAALTSTALHISTPHLPDISPISPLYLRRAHQHGLAVERREQLLVQGWG